MLLTRPPLASKRAELWPSLTDALAIGLYQGAGVRCRNVRWSLFGMSALQEWQLATGKYQQGMFLNPDLEALVLFVAAHWATIRYNHTKGSQVESQLKCGVEVHYLPFYCDKIQDDTKIHTMSDWMAILSVICQWCHSPHLLIPEESTSTSKEIAQTFPSSLSTLKHYIENSTKI